MADPYHPHQAESVTRYTLMVDFRGFVGGRRFLSNFFIEPDGTHVEGEFQQMKCADADDLMGFVGLNPAQAKARGQRVKLRDDWEDVKIGVMLHFVRQKFVDHPELLRQLKATHGPLIEYNTWGDEFWGICNGRGLNILGDILMQVRGEL